MAFNKSISERLEKKRCNLRKITYEGGRKKGTIGGKMKNGENGVEVGG